MAKLLEKQTIFVDTEKAPHIYTRYQFSKPLIKFLVTLLVIIVLVATLALIVVANAPKIEVHCTNAGILVFQEIETEDPIAYVKLADENQVDEIKKLNVLVDPSVNEFSFCLTEVHHYEIWLDDSIVFVHADDVKVIPTEYNHTLSTDEESNMLEASSEEVKYLYKELNRIFCIE